MISPPSADRCPGKPRSARESQVEGIVKIRQNGGAAYERTIRLWERGPEHRQVGLHAARGIVPRGFPGQIALTGHRPRRSAYRPVSP